MQPKPKRKRILFISGNYYPEPTGIGKYNGEMIDMLVQNGYTCTVITTYPYYPFWKVQDPYVRSVFRYKKECRILKEAPDNPITIYRCPHYVPQKPTAKGRVMMDFSFFIFSFFKMVQLMFAARFDFVLAVVPSFQVGLLGVLYKKIRKAKFIYHIQDLQIDAAKELQMIRSTRIINLLFRIERFILDNADVVSTISAGMISKISGRTQKDVVYFPNWVDTNSFFPLREQKDLKAEYNLQHNDKIILYSGSIGEKQGLDSILDVADTYKSVGYLKFVICGSGPYCVQLKKKAESRQLANIIFLPLQPPEKLNRLLNMADMHLVLQKANACDLVMPSKLTNILSVGGLAIIAANPNSSLYEIISGKGIGILVQPESRAALEGAIEYALKSDLELVRQNARHYAEESLSAERVFAGYIKYLS